MYSGGNSNFEDNIKEYRTIFRKFKDYVFKGKIPKHEYETFLSLIYDITNDNFPEDYKKKVSELVKEQKNVLTITEKIVIPEKEEEKPTMPLRYTTPEGEVTGLVDPGGN